MKYKVTETELDSPDYIHEEEFDSWADAHKRMLEMYHDNVIEGSPHAMIEKAFLYKNSALVVLNDGNEIEWKIDIGL